MPESHRFAAALVVVGAALVLIPEFFYLRDLFGSRMNTIFKFYFQGWTLLSLTAAYALARVPFRGRTLLLLTLLAVAMFPQIAVLSGLFELVRALGLYNRLSSLGISYLLFTLPFTVWILTTFLRELPRELEEAAIMDGASPLTILLRVFAPLMGPAVVTTALLAFIAAWNEFLFALTFTLPPRASLPNRISLANVFFRCSWITRLIGRAPISLS